MKDYITKSLQPGERVLAELECKQLSLSYLGTGEVLSAKTATVGLTNGRFYVLAHVPGASGLLGYPPSEQVMMMPVSNVLAAHLKFVERSRDRYEVWVNLYLAAAGHLRFMLPETAANDAATVQEILGVVMGQSQISSVVAQDTAPFVAWKIAEDERERKRRQDD